jgi:hypothetical protein
VTSGIPMVKDPYSGEMLSGEGCRSHPFGHMDSARRMADTVNLHWQAQQWDAVGKWVAIRLSDGGSDNVLYPTKGEAVRHQFHEFWCAYVRIIRDQMSVCEAQTMLEVSRRAYDAGMRLTDPDARNGGRDLLLSNRVEERKKVLSILRSGR